MKLSSLKKQPESTKTTIYQNTKNGNISLRFEGYRKSDVTFEGFNNNPQNLNLQNLRRSNTVRETSNSGSRALEEEFEIEWNRLAKY